MSNDERWYRVDHWGRFTGPKVNEVKYIRHTAKTIWIESTSPRRRELGQGDKYLLESEDHTFIQGRDAAYDHAINIADNRVTGAEERLRTARRDLLNLEQEKEDGC